LIPSKSLSLLGLSDRWADRAHIGRRARLACLDSRARLGHRAHPTSYRTRLDHVGAWA